MTANAKGEKPIETALKIKLKAAFAPEDMQIENQSDRHAGHGPEGEETHFRVRIISRAFEGKSRLQRHRMVNEILSDELKSAVHALSMETLTPAEARGTSL